LLVGGTFFARHRAGFVVVIAGVFGAVGFAPLWLDWVPEPSGTSTAGFWCGVAAAFIILFEMLLWARKRWSFLKRWFATRHWMFLHIWLGLLSLPLVIIHCGALFGGPLSAALLSLFLAVIASGVWGLCMQQMIPRKLLNEVAEETVHNAIDDLMRQHLQEADALLAPYLANEAKPLDEDERRSVSVQVRPRVPYRTRQIAEFYETSFLAYIASGRRASGLLASPARAALLFAELRRDAGDEILKLVDKLEGICDVRRQLDYQARLHWWLHAWLCIHVPLSVALTVLLGYHVVVALKYW
jgi:hypothetical protein